jgi:hypothetical protein
VAVQETLRTRSKERFNRKFNELRGHVPGAKTSDLGRDILDHVLSRISASGPIKCMVDMCNLRKSFRPEDHEEGWFEAITAVVQEEYPNATVSGGKTMFEFRLQ